MFNVHLHLQLVLQNENTFKASSKIDLKITSECSLDKYGQKLYTVAGAKGDAMRTLHDAFLAALAPYLRQAGIKFLHNTDL